MLRIYNSQVKWSWDLNPTGKASVFPPYVGKQSIDLNLPAGSAQTALSKDCRVENTETALTKTQEIVHRSCHPTHSGSTQHHLPAECGRGHIRVLAPRLQRGLSRGRYRLGCWVHFH